MAMQCKPNLCVKRTKVKYLGISQWL